MDSSYPSNVPLVLALNPRIPFTHIGVFYRTRMVFLTKLMHPCGDLARFSRYVDQAEYRTERILEELRNNDIDISQIRLVISRGGLVRPVKAGIYHVNDQMIRDLREEVSGSDVVNLGGLIAAEMASRIEGADACVAEPVVVDEYEEFARISGHPHFRRRSVFHALEQKTVARKYAQMMQHKYEDLNLIVGHLGNGITVGAHRHGRVIDANQGLDGDGPFSPSRSGSLPAGDLVRLCFSGQYSRDEVMHMISTEGGLYAYLGTPDGYTADRQAREGEEKSIFFLRAMGYQVAKTIGAMYTVLEGNVDAILLTGGLTHSRILMDEIMKRIEKMAPVHVYPDENDVEILAVNGNYLLNGEIEALEYQ
jgi:butyrate kinase